MDEGRCVYRVLVGRPEGKRPLGRHVDWRIILRWIFRKWDARAWTGWMWLRTGTRWGALVNVLMNLRFLEMWGIS
jgi:hypothetical protein